MTGRVELGQRAVEPGLSAPSSFGPVSDDGLCRHLLRLGPKSRYFRFGYPASDDAIMRYCVAANKNPSILCGIYLQSVLRGVVEIRSDPVYWQPEAELALSVEDDWQNWGLGSDLMKQALLAARDSGIERLIMIYLSENIRMRNLARNFCWKTALTGSQIRAENDPFQQLLEGGRRNLATLHSGPKLPLVMQN